MPGPTAFSVGEGAAWLVDTVADVDDGASFSVEGLHAVRVLMATNAPPPATIAIRWLRRPEFMLYPFTRGFPPSCHAAARQGAVKPSRLCAPSQNGLFSEWPHRHR